MPNIVQAKKRMRQNSVINSRNRSQKSEMRTLIKQMLSAIAEKNLDKSKSCFKIIAKRLQQLASKKLIKKNKAARLTSRLNKKLKSLATA